MRSERLSTLLKVIVQRMAVTPFFLEVFMNRARLSNHSAGDHIIELIHSINIDNNKED